MHLFYQPDIQPVSELSDEEAHHAFHVLRLREGQQIGLVDGRGKTAIAAVLAISKKGLTAEVISERITPPPDRSFHLAIAPVKNMDRFEWLTEKATETGVSVITPLICRRSERKELKTDRLRKLIVAASKQSQRSWFPVLNEPIPFADFLTSRPPGEGFIAHCLEGEKSPASVLRQSANAVVMIGPEGDFDVTEIHAALEAGFKPLSLGESRLRTETAGLVSAIAFLLA